MKSKVEIKTWDQVDGFMLNLGGLDSTIEKHIINMNDQCQRIKEECGKHIKMYQDSRDEVLEALEEFFIAHEDDPEVKGKTYEDPIGNKCGLRMTPPSVKPLGKMTWEKVLVRIVGLGYIKKLLRPLVFSIKDIDREMLASDKVSDDLRKEIGVKLHQEERFWYEVK